MEMEILSRAPHEFPRRILLLAAGLTPQIVTETVYALAHQDPPYYPTEIHLITTAEGAERANLVLLGHDPGWFRRLIEEYGLPQMRFDANCIHVLLDANGQPLRDIRSESDNEIVADQVTECIKEFTSDPRSALHVSMAGGRKTLGFFLAYALSLFGRPQDELSHVLVDPPYESHPEFFYPTRNSRIIYTGPPDHRPLDTREARVTLARIPFVRLRPLLRTDPIGQKLRFSEVVRLVQEAVEPSLVIDLGECHIQAAGQQVHLPPVDLAFYAWLAQRQQRGLEPVTVPSEGCPEMSYAKEFLAIFTKIPSPRSDVPRVKKALKEGMTKEYFLQRKARVNRTLERNLGAAAAPYLVTPCGKRPETRFGVALSANRIQIKQS